VTIQRQDLSQSKVIELAQRGIRDPDELRTMTLKEFGLSDESTSVGSAAPSEMKASGAPSK
jgi:hypothetical protein